eukprot:1930084-Alexandrium_andersonii.AAC.1
MARVGARIHEHLARRAQEGAEAAAAAAPLVGTPSSSTSAAGPSGAARSQGGAGEQVAWVVPASAGGDP